MKKTAFVLGTIFTLLTFAGAAYVLYHGGRVSAGYAVVPCALATAYMAWFRQQ
ncbi:MAG: hypothetical protein IJB67_06710 [Firmicutes bacterium]|nr:hypothetical protein [Bacillota bacterium]